MEKNPGSYVLYLEIKSSLTSIFFGTKTLKDITFTAVSLHTNAVTHKTQIPCCLQHVR